MRHGAQGLLFTMALGVGLAAVDRLWLGVDDPGVYVATTMNQDVPGAPPLPLPPYLPSELAWPPAQVWRQFQAPFGFWMGLRAVDGGEMVLWMGTPGQGVPPEELGAVRACVLGETPRCPSGWFPQSARLWDGRQVVVWGRLGDEEVARIAEGLGLSRARP